MAIIMKDDKSNGNNNNNTNQSVNTNQQTQQPHVEAPQQQGSYGFGNIQPNVISGVGTSNTGLTGMAALQALYGNAISLDTGSSILNAYLDFFRETYAEKRKNGQATIQAEFIGLPQETLQLPYSGIAVCYIHANGVTVHTLLLEDDGPLPDPKPFTVHGRETIEVPITPADTYNEAYYQTVIAQVKAKFGNVEIFDAGMQVIYRTIDLEDVNQVNRILTIATNATVGATSLQTVGSDVNEGRTLAQTLSANGIMLHASVNTSPERLISPNGLPIRRDIVVKSVATVPGATQNNLRGTHGSGFRFAELSAFATLEYVAPEAPQYTLYQQMPVNAPTQRYVPRIVITSVDSDGIQTLPSVLLGISTATVIQEGMLWTEPFRPQKGRLKSEIDIKDIGAIGYDIKELNTDDKPGMINTKSNDFTTQDFYQLMATTVYSSPIYSIDIEEAGSLSWLTQILAAAAANDPAATRAIIDACNSLTNGEFGRIFEGGPILQSDDNRVFLGTYRPHGDTAGELRDIRDLDYLAILNLCGEDPQIVEDFEKTQRANSGLPQVVRLHELQGILEQIMGPSLSIKGYANRFTFHHAFIEALTKSTRAAKVAPMFSNLPVHQQQTARQRVNDFQWAMVNANAVGGVYQGGMGQVQAGMPLTPFNPYYNIYNQ